MAIVKKPTTKTAPQQPAVKSKATPVAKRAVKPKSKPVAIKKVLANKQTKQPAKIAKPKKKPTKKAKSGNPPGVNHRKGIVSERVRERLAMKKHFLDRIVKATDKLFNAQYSLAIGTQVLMVKVTERTPKGKIIRQYHEQVTSPQTIIDYLDGELEGGNSISDEDHFYYMTTRDPDNRALKDMLDRAYGRPTEKVVIEPDENSDNIEDLSDDELENRLAAYYEKRRSGKTGA